MQRKTFHRLAGFTLIELMITVAIVAILAAIAYPSYMGQVRKGKRAEAKAKLLQAVQRQERFYTDNSAYSADLAPLFGMAGGTAVYSGDANDAGSPYRITVTPAAGGIATGFTLTATQNGGFADPSCGNLTLTNTGVKGITGTSTVRNCW
jgi:type IV pilus assembly protein PilE